jgi:hypothetical protein
MTLPYWNLVLDGIFLIYRHSLLVYKSPRLYLWWESVFSMYSKMTFSSRNESWKLSMMVKGYGEGDVGVYGYAPISFQWWYCSGFGGPNTD